MKTQSEKAVMLEIATLHPFRDNPFTVKQDVDFDLLKESIRDNGVVTPIMVCPDAEHGGYEIISGHRRVEVCKQLGITTIPSVVREMSRDEAVITLVDCNIQREALLPSEKAYGYKMKLDAMKHQGRATDFTCGQAVHKSRDMVSDEDSGRMVQRYIRLTNLEKQLLAFVDEGRIALTPAVQLSYLGTDEQLDIVEMIEQNDATPSYAQTVQMRKLSEAGILDTEAIDRIMGEPKGNQVDKIKIPYDRISKYFGRETPMQTIEDTIVKALDYYSRAMIQKRNRNSRDER